MTQGYRTICQEQKKKEILFSILNFLFNDLKI